METNCGINTVLLLDSFDLGGRMLYQAFMTSGFRGQCVVINDDGFLPEGVISLYRYFCGPYKDQPGVPGKPRYFNQIERPDYWEIEGNNTGGKVMDLGHERGRIFYAEPYHKRLVSTVDWLDTAGNVCSSDHYDCYGALYARTIFTKQGKRFCKTYYDAAGREVIVENFVTGDIVLNRDEKVYVFHSKVELTMFLFETAGIAHERIFYNSLSVPFFVSEEYPSSGENGDILFWQEGVRPDIPGNMQIILKGQSSRTGTIFVQKRESFDKIIALGASPAIVKSLGFVYNFVRECTFGQNALICTNSDEIEHLSYLVQNLPEVQFHIAALTEMSSKLMNMAEAPNVSVYPNVKSQMLAELFEKCDLYLDINRYNEIVSAVSTAFLHNQLILGFGNTLHNRMYTAEEHRFEEPEKMADLIRQVVHSQDIFREHLELQKRFAMAENALDYKIFL